MTPAGIVRTGAIGAAGTGLGASLSVLALCCAKPAATLALGAGAGLAGTAVWLEWVWLLVPPLLGFLALLAYGLHRQGRAAAEGAVTVRALPRPGAAVVPAPSRRRAEP